MSEQRGQVTSPIQVQLIALAVSFSNVVHAVVLLLLDAFSMPEGGFLGEDAPPVEVLGPVLLVAAVAAVVGSFPFKRMMLTQAGTGAGLAAKTRIMLVSMAIVDSAGVMGLVMGLVTGDMRWALVLCGVGLAGSILHFPTRAWLEEEG